MKRVFDSHYIDIPDEKYDVLEAQSEKIAELEEKINETIEKNKDLHSSNSNLVREQVMSEVSEDLADTEKEKLGKLAEGIDFEDKSQYSEKLEVIKENYFPKQQSETITEELENTEKEQDSSEPEIDPIMSKYTSALTRLNK